MTIEEALAHISDIRRSPGAHSSFEQSQGAILDILCQLAAAQSESEFTVRRLCEQLSKLEGSWIEIDGDQEWSIGGYVDKLSPDDAQGIGVDALRRQLDKLVQPPPELSDQDVLPVPLTVSVIRFCAGYRDGEIAKACRAVLEKHNDKGTSATKD